MVSTIKAADSMVTDACRDWWAADHAKKFLAKAANLGAQFDACEPLLRMHVNGKLTMGENIADLGGDFSPLKTVERRTIIAALRLSRECHHGQLLWRLEHRRKYGVAHANRAELANDGEGGAETPQKQDERGDGFRPQRRLRPVRASSLAITAETSSRA